MNEATNLQKAIAKKKKEKSACESVEAQLEAIMEQAHPAIPDGGEAEATYAYDHGYSHGSKGKPNKNPHAAGFKKEYYDLGHQHGCEDKKLRKEEAGQIDELSTKTLMSYKKKAIDAAQDALQRPMPYGDDTIHKRTSGYNKALDKIKARGQSGAPSKMKEEEEKADWQKAIMATADRIKKKKKNSTRAFWDNVDKRSSEIIAHRKAQQGRDWR